MVSGVPVRSMNDMASVTDLPDLDELIDVGALSSLDRPWVTIVWNDPVNLMQYVTHVFRSYFGMPTEKAKELMLQVHNDGRAIVASGPREEMERHTEAMHEYGLWATAAKDGGI